MHDVAGARATTSLGHLWLTNFRCFAQADLELAPGLTVLYGANGQGKTSLLEAVTWVARTKSFRGVSDAMLVRAGADEAIVRADVRTGTREQLFEAEIRVSGRNRVMWNRQAVARTRDLHGNLRVTVFSPDDLALLKGGPAERREYLDQLLAMLSPRYDAARTDVERLLKQRNALLRGGVRDEEARATLDVFDEQYVRAAAELTRGRVQLVERLRPLVARDYAMLAHDVAIDLQYEADWSGRPLHVDDVDRIEPELRVALTSRRSAEMDRGLTLVGPHRDDVRCSINSLDARHQASQGEQRTFALALRLAGHETVGEVTDTAPLLLLDDVFSELDAERAAALVRGLPTGQTLLTTAGAIPPDVVPERRLRIASGRIEGLDP